MFQNESNVKSIHYGVDLLEHKKAELAKREMLYADMKALFNQ